MGGIAEMNHQLVLPWLQINTADDPPGYRIHTGLYPTGKWGDPCEVQCDACDYRDTAPSMPAAQRLSFIHDRTHTDVSR
jgi:hypothetical protein